MEYAKRNGFLHPEFFIDYSVSGTIFERLDFQRMQTMIESKRRNTKAGKSSLFSGLVYCADCGAKLHFCAAKNLMKNQKFFRCSIS